MDAIDNSIMSYTYRGSKHTLQSNNLVSRILYYDIWTLIYETICHCCSF
jgi:hypothetical protein